MTFACDDCGATDAVRYVTTDVRKARTGPNRGERTRVGVYYCRDCFTDRYPRGTWGAKPAGTDPAGPDWLPDDVRRQIAESPD